MEHDSINIEDDSIDMEDDSIDMEDDSIDDSIDMEDDSIDDSIDMEDDSIDMEDERHLAGPASMATYRWRDWMSAPMVAVPLRYTSLSMLADTARSLNTAPPLKYVSPSLPLTRGLHSSTLQLNVRTMCGLHQSTCQLDVSTFAGDGGSFFKQKMSHVELRSGR